MNWLHAISSYNFVKLVHKCNYLFVFCIEAKNFSIAPSYYKRSSLKYQLVNRHTNSFAHCVLYWSKLCSTECGMSFRLFLVVDPHWWLWKSTCYVNKVSITPHINRPMDFTTSCGVGTLCLGFANYTSHLNGRTFTFVDPLKTLSINSYSDWKG